MFRRINQQELLKKPIKEINSGNLNKIRILDSISLRKINDSQSVHSSVMSQSRHSSIKHLPNASIVSSQFSMRSSLVKSRSIDKKKIVYKRQQMIEELFQRHYGLPFIKSLVQYLNREWSGKQKQLLQQKKIQNFVQSVIQRSNWIKDLIDEFVEKEYSALPGQDRYILMSLLFKQSTHSISDLEGVIPQIVKKIPDERVFRQQMIIQELSAKIMEIYDPKCIYSNMKMKERISLYMEEYTVKKNDLKADLCTKLIPSLHFLENMEQYLSTYQKEIIKLKSQIHALEQQKNRYQALLDKKSTFTPLNIDYDKLYQMKYKTNQAIRQDLDLNIVQYHQEKHKRDQKIIFEVEEIEHKLRDQNDQLKNAIALLNEQLSNLKSNAPQHTDYGAQVYLITQSKGSEGSGGQRGNLLTQFLDNVITPFSFNLQIAGSLINVLSIDKILFDYETIRLRDIIKSFEEFLFEWFIIRTGCRKIAQIFVKNFLYSLKELRTSHKRFALFYRICGHSGFRKRNLQQDLQGVFFTTHLCWYYIIKLSLMYRRKLNENPTGYHLFPPLQCQDIFKLPLRKIYELVEQFFRSQEIELPTDLTQLIDHYCINQISKFKSNDEAFQKESLEEIHILRDINFDLIAGFILQYISNLKCSIVQKLLRTIDSKQKQEGNVVGYSEFQSIYRRYFKERRAKIQQIYAKLCMVNQYDMLDIQNLQPVVFAILEDQSPLRSIFQKLQPLKVLILSDKTAIIKNDKKPTNVNSYENFRERYYHEFYDFYNTTAFLEEVFKIVRVLVKKRLKKGQITQQYIDKLVEFKLESKRPVDQSKKSSSGSSSDQDEESVKNNRQEEQEAVTSNKKSEYETKNILVTKLEEWAKIMTRVPHFATKVLTIDQIIIHNMRRKEMIEATEYAWKTLREILTILGKE